MQKRSKKSLVWVLVVSLVLTQMLFTSTAFASTRLSGADRYATAIAISQNWTSAKVAVIARGDDAADALSAAPVAYANDAPILLTESAKLSDGVLTELKRLGVDTVIIAGGTGAVSQAVEDAIKAGITGVTVDRVAGADRYETSVKMAQKLTGVTEVFVANGYAYADALSVASLAAHAGAPILLTDTATVPDSVKNYIGSDKDVYVVGGTGVVGSAVETALGATRLSGADRYATNLDVLGNLDADYSTVYLATGNDAADALAGSALAAQTGSPIVLVDGTLSTAAGTFLAGKVASDSKVVALGGTGVVSAAAVTALENVVNGIQFKVESVTSLNATQVAVKFTQAVDPASLFADGVSGAFNGSATVTLTTLDSQASGSLTGTLSADGKTLTVTAANVLSKRYDVVVDGLTSKDGDAIVKYAELVTLAADTTAPTVVSTTKVSAGVFTVTFSEPMKTLGTVSYKLADGTVVAGSGTGVTNDFSAGKKVVTFTVGTDVAANKQVVATIIGAQDQAGNLLAPNPATVSFVKGAADGTAPTVVSVTQTGAKTFAVKFSEELIATPTVTVNGTSAASVDKDDTDATKYNVTAASVLDGLSNVAVSSFTDLSGEAGTAVTKVIGFVKDTGAPKVVSSAVVVDSTDRKEYLEITFDKDVYLTTPTVAATGSYVKNYVTTSATVSATTIAYKASTNKKVVRVALATLLTGQDVEGATYTLPLTFAGVASGANVAADNTAKATFTRGEDGVAASSTVAHVTGVAQGADNNKVNVTFDTAVDGASATTVANYSIDGAVVESVTLLPASSGTQVAVVNLKAGSNGFTGVRNINIANVKALGSTKVMTPYFTNSVSLNENVAPVVTSAKLTSTTTIALTFSEAVTDSTGLDFDVLVGGESQATPNTVSVNTGSTGVTTVTVTVTSIDATELSKGISLKALSTLDIEDAVGNALSVPANIVVTQ